MILIDLTYRPISYHSALRVVNLFPGKIAPHWVVAYAAPSECQQIELREISHEGSHRWSLFWVAWSGGHASWLCSHLIVEVLSPSDYGVMHSPAYGSLNAMLAEMGLGRNPAVQRSDRARSITVLWLTVSLAATGLRFAFIARHTLGFVETPR